MTNSATFEANVGQVVRSLLLGESRAVQRLRWLIARLATSPAPVLIEGPTGVGKELVAEALHLCSGRPGAFVPFNVCAIADGTFESQLFGHVRGAFTGAVQDAHGYLAEADRGTAFFDEISSLSTVAQAKLLRAIETHTFRPVGARHDRTSEFRLVAASNEDLAALVSEGRFRIDLYHRLRAFLIRVPALAERLEDIPILARHFARRAADGSTCRLSDAAIASLQDHLWPGNVRELRNVVEFSLALAGGETVGPAEVAEALGVTPLTATPARTTASRQSLTALLSECGWDTTRVATRLGLHRSNVYRMMRRLGISPPRRRQLSEGAVSLPAGFALFADGDANSRSIRANPESSRIASSE